MAPARPNTKVYAKSARDDLGLAVIRAREAWGHPYRPSFVRIAPGVSLRSLVKLETGEPVGPAIYEAVGRVLPNWTEDTPRIILEGGPVPPTAATAPAPKPVDPRVARLRTLFYEWREEFGRETAHRMVRAEVDRLNTEAAREERERPA